MRECGACGTLVALEGLAWRHFDGVGKQPVCAGCLGAVDGSDAEAADSPEGGSAGAGRGAGEEGASGSEAVPSLRKRQRGRQRRVEGQADGGKDLDPTSLQEDVEYLWYAEGAGRWLRVRMGPVQDGVAVLLLCDAAEATALGSDLVEDVTLAQHRFQPAGSRRSGSRRRSRRLSARHSSS